MDISQLPPVEVEQRVRILKQSHWQISRTTAVPYTAKSYIITNNLCRNWDYLNKVQNVSNSVLLGKIYDSQGCFWWSVPDHYVLSASMQQVLQTSFLNPKEWGVLVWVNPCIGFCKMQQGLPIAMSFCLSKLHKFVAPSHCCQHCWVSPSALNHNVLQH